MMGLLRADDAEWLIWKIELLTRMPVKLRSHEMSLRDTPAPRPRLKCS